MNEWTKYRLPEHVVKLLSTCPRVERSVGDVYRSVVATQCVCYDSVVLADFLAQG